MKRNHSLLLGLFLCLAGVSRAEEPIKEPTPVKTLQELKALPKETRSLLVNFTHKMAKDKTFVPLMKEIAATPRFTKFQLILPNSSHVTNKDLEVLREFKHLETFNLEDNRDFGGDIILKQAMMMPKLTKVTLGFR